jgi:hypothetical protein
MGTTACQQAAHTAPSSGSSRTHPHAAQGGASRWRSARFVAARQFVIARGRVAGARLPRRARPGVRAECAGQAGEAMGSSGSSMRTALPQSRSRP